MDLPHKNAAYKLQDYWNERYTKEENFEWCKSYDDFKDLIHKHLRNSDKILMLGCGNSALSEQMYKDGYRNIVNIDFSPVVIENMKRKYKHLVEMEWLVMDITNLTFSPNSFEVVVEKATLDALMVEERDLWNPSQEVRDRMDSVLKQVSHTTHNFVLGNLCISQLGHSIFYPHLCLPNGKMNSFLGKD